MKTSQRDLDAAYEELQSTIDELQTTNEQLQSASEELQTMNEELHATTEELETELNRVNDCLEAILASLGLAVAVLDRRQRVLAWNRRAEELWELRRNEAVDRPFLGLDIRLERGRVAAALQAVIDGASPEEKTRLAATNRSGRRIECATTIVPLGRQGSDGTIHGAIVLMEDRGAAAEHAVRPRG